MLIGFGNIVLYAGMRIKPLELKLNGVNATHCTWLWSNHSEWVGTATRSMAEPKPRKRPRKVSDAPDKKNYIQKKKLMHGQTQKTTGVVFPCWRMLVEEGTEG